jgi:hypothetical protein
MSDPQPPKDDFRLMMRIGMEVLEHLGMKMYTSLPAVISEYVANAWDAGATNVDIEIPKKTMDDDYEITINDNGFGMTFDEINKKFLIVGRNRRDDDGDSIQSIDGEERKVMGRKGIGKLAGFGVAGAVEVWTCKDGNYVNFEMDYDAIQEKAKQADPNEKGEYSPELLEVGETNPDVHGTVVTLKNFDREQRPAISTVRRKLSRRFGVINTHNFDITVNGNEIGPDERDLKRTCEYVWHIGEDVDVEDKDKEFHYSNGSIGEGQKFDIEGWIGTRKQPVDDVENGIAILVRGKLAQEPDFFGARQSGFEGQVALTYMLGEIRADFLDDNKDLIATDRASVHWEKEPASTLHSWLEQAIKDVSKDWNTHRTDEKLEGVKETPVYQNRIKHLSAREKKLADDFLSQVAEIEGYDDEILTETADYVASAVEKKAFRDLLGEIKHSEDSETEKIVKLFREWEILDAVEAFRRAENRLDILKEFEKLINSDIDEEQIHDFLVRNPGLLDPRWDSYDKEVTFQQELRERFGDDAEVEGSNRRMDLFCIKDSTSIQVIELKKANRTVGYNELQQIQHYINYIKGLEGSEFEGKRTVGGMIIGGRIANDASARELLESLEIQGIRHKTYEQLRDEAWDVYGEFVEVIEEKAEALNDERLMNRAESIEHKAEGRSSTSTESS